MKEKHLAGLEKLGLPTAEAEIYLVLARAGTPMSASAIVTATGVPRGSIYPTLSALADKGLVETEPGYGGRFSAIPAERALPFLIAREKEELVEREHLAGLLANELRSERDPGEGSMESEFVQVIKDQRVVSERFERLLTEAKRQIDVFTKPPFNPNRGSNPALEAILRRGVRARSLYEKATLEDPAVKPYLSTWVTWGEEARVYDGELPHKLVIFDAKVVLMPLILPGEQTKSLLISHPRIAESLSLAFDHLWEQSKPLIARKRKTTSASTKKPAMPASDADHHTQRLSHNGRRSHAARE